MTQLQELPRLPVSPENSRQVRKITWLGMVLNVFLAVLKFVVGIIGNSQAVIADGFHSLSDMITDVSVLLGVKHWSAPPDDEHPYGHLRIEAMVTVFIGIVLVVIALGIGFNAVTSLKGKSITAPGIVAITGSIFSVVFKEAIFQVTLRVGRRTKSTALIANAWHHRSDALSSIPVLAAVILANLDPTLAYVDQIGAVIVTIFILKVSWDIIKPAVAELADRGGSEGDRERIGRIAAAITGVKEVHAIRTRKLGPGFYVDLHVLVEPEITVREGHVIAEEVRVELLERGPEVYDVIVHLEPYEEEKKINDKLHIT